MRFDERALVFGCHNDWLYGIASVPEAPSQRGVLIVVGGPQYRAGSHRQFTLLARELAQNGIPALRFDYRGMGDSEGAARDFDAAGDDIGAAIDQFFAVVPSMRELVIWGLCDAASAALCHASADPRVAGMVLLNPWARTEASLAKATLKHYYRDRLLQPELWRKILSGHFDFRAAARSLRAQFYAAFTPAAHVPASAELSTTAAALPDRMCAGLRQFRGKVLLIVSGADLTAREFCDMAAASPEWRRLLAAPNVTRRELARADHTFARAEWRRQVATWTADWVRSW